MDEKAKDAVRSRQARTLWTGLGLIVVCGALVALSAYLLGPLADTIACHDVEGVAAADRAKELRIARDAARGRIIQVVLGFLAVGGFVYTARNFTLARHQSELNRQTLELATLQGHEQMQATRRALEQSESSQMTDRFMRAIDQLGSESAADVRIGGIHSLERIAQDSPRDHQAVVEALAAFVLRSSASRGDDVPLDLQAAMTALVRRSSQADRGRLKLQGARLEGLDLVGANLSGACLGGAHLADADLTDADLSCADLTGATLGNVKLAGACLDDALLADAVLTGAQLSSATLARAQLCRADLSGAALRDAILQQANAREARLRGTDLTRADLTGADLTRADLAEAVIEDSMLAHSTLHETILTGVRADRAKLAGSVLTSSVISGASLCHADLRDCQLQGANLSGARLHAAVLDGVDLSVIKLVGLDLSGALIHASATLPSGWQRAPDGTLARIRP
ncbi:pentapeptide repeat-containing protein [Nonomuraea sp. NPDC055795]